MADVLVPPFDIMFLTGIWIETLLYGVKFVSALLSNWDLTYYSDSMVVFAAAIFVLARMYRDRKASATFLLLTSVFLFSLSTVYVAVCLRQLLEAFIWGPPGQASLYFSNVQDRLSLTKLALYDVNILIQDMILIWRMWVVYSNRWVVIILPIVMELGRVSAAIYALRLGAIPHISVFEPSIYRGAIAAWTLDLALNIGVTSCIAYKLWTAGRSLKHIGFTRSKNPYTGIMLTIIESGGIFATATLIMVSLYFSGNYAFDAATDSVVQLATITPLLIVVRVGLGLQHGIPANTMTFEVDSSDLYSSSRSQGLRVNISESQNTFDDGTTAAIELERLESSTTSVRNVKTGGVQ
ncbi:hypothetical protein FB446DRAFT_196640 [Lentinula raphanica]|nr:hypothetical protein FB446DRAFT_196640 [Lentinula raphanica]